MITLELTEYIRSQLALNTSEEAIVKSLMANGWAAQDIAAAFASVAQGVSAPVSVSVEASPSVSLRGKLLLSIGLIVASTFYAFSQQVKEAQQLAAIAKTLSPISKQNTAPAIPVVAAAGTSSVPSIEPNPAALAALRSASNPTVALRPPVAPKKRPSTPVTKQTAPVAIASTQTQAPTPPASPSVSAPLSTPDPTPVSTTDPTPVSTPDPTPPPVPTPPPPPPPPPPTPVPQGQYVDGTYTGIPADAYYGIIQVEIVISGGALTDVIFLQSPSDRRTSIEINKQAMPVLRQEALTAQSATVDIVSGATDSSQAFQQSLGDALDQANV